MTEIKSNITCTRCGKDILYCNCENSLRTKMERLEKENAELKEKLCDILTKIDCFLCIKSTIREDELYDLQQLIKNNGFKFKNDRWELAE